jgi:hypothetical protein
MRAPFWLCCVFLGRPALAADQADAPGRDFPKTLTFDEPGIDDEISLPTLIVLPRGPGQRQTDVDFELDKRLTTWLSLQINAGYTTLSRANTSVQGWQNINATLKFVVDADPVAERLVSLSFTREFGGSGAGRIGAASFGATVPAVNVGQGFSAIAAVPLLTPVALTGSFGAIIPDRPGRSTVQAVLSASLQYSFDVLMSGPVAARLPQAVRPLIPIVECVMTEPDGAASVTLAPGLIYSGHGYQVAAEALMPLTREAGSHVGFIAQLNISLSVFGWPVLDSIL